MSMIGYSLIKATSISRSVSRQVKRRYAGNPRHAKKRPDAVTGEIEDKLPMDIPGYGQLSLPGDRGRLTALIVPVIRTGSPQEFRSMIFPRAMTHIQIPSL